VLSLLKLDRSSSFSFEKNEGILLSSIKCHIIIISHYRDKVNFYIKKKEKYFIFFYKMKGGVYRASYHINQYTNKATGLSANKDSVIMPVITKAGKT
jgi:hypothetical protein